MSNITEQDIISTSTEFIVIDNSLPKLKNDDLTSEFVVTSDGGDLADQLCNSFPITNQITSAGDADDAGLLYPALLIPEHDEIVACRPADDNSMENTAFPVEELIRPAVEIDMKRSPSYVSVPKPDCLEEPIFKRCDESDTITTVRKPGRRSVWKRTKHFFRRLFCCGDVKVRHPSSGIIAELTDFVDGEIDIGSLPPTAQPIDSSQPAGDFLLQTTLRVDDFRAPIATECGEHTDPPTALLEEKFIGSVKTNIEQSNCHIEGQLNERSASMRILDLPTESAGDKLDIDDWPPAIERKSMIELPRSADEYQQRTSLDLEELNSPIGTNVQRPMYDLEGPLQYKRFVSMMTLDLPTENAGDEVDIGDWPPAMIEVIEPISIVESPRSTDQYQLETTLKIEELNGQIKTDAKQSSCDPVDSPINQDPVPDLLIAEAKPKHRPLWRRVLCCCC